jgi:branched-subunit amino acid transport protein AzlD
MTTPDYLLAALIMGGVTFALRAFPFVARHLIAHHPRIQILGQRLPIAMMLLLTLYAMGVYQWQSLSQGKAQLLAVLVVAGLQAWRRQAMVSILSGTLFYLALMNGWLGG